MMGGNDMSLGNDPGMGDDPSLGGDQGLGSDIGGGMEDTGMGEDMSDPGMSQDMGGEEGLEPENGNDSNQGHPKAKYIKDMVDDVATSDPEKLDAIEGYVDYLANDNAGGAEESAEEPEQNMMAESLCITKRQLRELNERLRDNHDDNDRMNKKKGNDKKINRKSPFNSPLFK